MELDDEEILALHKRLEALEVALAEFHREFYSVSKGAPKGEQSFMVDMQDIRLTYKRTRWGFKLLLWLILTTASVIVAIKTAANSLGWKP